MTDAAMSWRLLATSRAIVRRLDEQVLQDKEQMTKGLTGLAGTAKSLGVFRINAPVAQAADRTAKGEERIIRPSPLNFPRAPGLPAPSLLPSANLSGALDILRTRTHAQSARGYVPYRHPHRKYLRAALRPPHIPSFMPAIPLPSQNA